MKWVLNLRKFDTKEFVTVQKTKQAHIKGEKFRVKKTVKYRTIHTTFTLSRLQTTRPPHLLVKITHWQNKNRIIFRIKIKQILTRDELQQKPQRLTSQHDSFPFVQRYKQLLLFTTLERFLHFYLCLEIKQLIAALQLRREMIFSVCFNDSYVLWGEDSVLQKVLERLH